MGMLIHPDITGPVRKATFSGLSARTNYYLNHGLATKDIMVQVLGKLYNRRISTDLD